MKVHVDTLRSLDWPWPPHDRVPEDCVGADGMIDLDAVIARIEASRAYHQRQQDEMYAFAARWNADVDDTTDRRDEVAGAIRACQDAIRAVREVADAVGADPPRRRKPPKPYVPREYTAAYLTSVAERGRLPNRDELRGLLDTYFVGPIDDALVARIVRELRDVDRNALRTSFKQAAEGLFPLERHRGTLWAERVWNGTRYDQDGAALALYFIASRADAPTARRYCPELVAGTWVQTSPGRATWTFGADGTFAIDAPGASHDVEKLGTRDRWAVQTTDYVDAHRGEAGDLRGNDLVLQPGNDASYSMKLTLKLSALTTTRLELTGISTGLADRYVLERPATAYELDADEVHRGRAVGRVLSRRYRLEQLISSGTHGAIYEASVLDGGHPTSHVAVRVLTGLDDRQRAQAEDVARWRLRASIGGQYIGDIEWRVDAGEPVLHVMELLTGRPTLRDVLGGGALPVRRACGIAEQLARGIHSCAPTHGSLRPSCVYLLTDPHGDDHVKIVDIGLAGVVANPHETRSGPPPDAETIMYTTPQRLRREDDRNPDAYAIGAILYTMLAGHPPYAVSENVYQLAMEVATQPPAPLTGVPREVVAIVERAMAPFAERPMAHQLATALAELRREL